MSSDVTIFDPDSPLPAEFNENVSLAKEAIKRQLPLIVICMIIGGIAAMLFTATQPRTYTATSSVQIEQQSDNVVGDDDKANPPPPSSDAERQLNTQLDILRSRAMGARVAKDLRLLGNPRFYAAMNVDPTLWGVPAGGSTQTLLDATASLMSANVEVALPKDSRIASISFSSGDPYLSAKVANSYAYNLISLNLERRFRSSDYARNYLNDQVADARSKLEASQREMNDFARRAGLVNADNPAGAQKGAGSVTESTLIQLNEALSTARAKRIEAEQQLRAASGSDLMSVPQVVSNPTVQKLLSDLATQQEALSEARARYTDKHPAVVTAETRVRQLQEQLQSAAASVRSSLEAEYRAAAGQETELASEVAAAKSQTQSEQDRSVGYDTLSHDVDTNRTLYDQLLQRQREVSTAAGVALNNISVLDEAAPPSQPSWPKSKLNLVLGVLLGMILGVALAIAREMIDDRVDGPHELERKLHLTSLGEVPLIRQREPGAAVASLDEPDSPLAVSYAACRTALQFSTRDGLPQHLVVTSSDAGEGKTLTALAIARSLASAGKRVLLIEADLRGRSLTEWLNLEETAGLSAVLTEQASFDEAIQQSVYPNLDIIAAGPQPPNPPDILDPERMAGLLASANRVYDCTIIDAPAVGNLADAPLLAAASGYVMFVIAAGTNHRGRARAALRRLGATGATIVGSVITKVPSTPFNVPAAGLLRRLRKPGAQPPQLPKAA
jgi:capsular exopolysaccharide synthesis family protein